MSTSIILNSKDGNEKSLSRTISYVNPDAADSKLITFAQAVNAVTNNTYVSTTKVTKRNLEDESKATRVITRFGLVSSSGNITTIPLDTGKLTVKSSQLYSSGTSILFRIATPYDGSAPVMESVSYSGQQSLTQANETYGHSSYLENMWNIGYSIAEAEAGVLSFNLHFNESPTYQAFDLPIEITITDDEEG